MRRKPRAYIYTAEPACTACGSIDTQSKRSTQQGDGSVLQHRHCRQCGESFFNVKECVPPKFGNVHMPRGKDGSMGQADLLSLSFLAVQVQAPPDDVRRAINDLHIKPAATIDGRPYFKQGHADRIRARLAAPPPAGHKPPRSGGLTLILQGGEFNGHRVQRQPPALGTLIEVFFNAKAAPTRWGETHHYAAAYNGGHEVTLPYQGVVPRPIDPFQLAEVGEG